MSSYAEDHGLVLVQVSGPRLDAAAAPGLKAAMLPAFEAKPNRAVIDLAEVQFMDSTGLGVLVSLMKYMATDGAMVIAGAQPAVRRLFEITRLNQVLPLYPDADAARAALGVGA